MLSTDVERSVTLEIFEDYSGNYWESTQETLVGLYSVREPETGKPTETVNDIIHRVAWANAIAELKYILSPQELIYLPIEDALKNPAVREWAKVIAEHIGNQKFWANTPANINADPKVALNVLKYWAHGVLAGFEEDDIWLSSEKYRKMVVSGRGEELDHHRHSMGKLAQRLKGKGCLAACGVAYVEDTLDGIQKTAKIEALAAKAAMGMGLNTSTLRPWASTLSGGAAASGPDRFYGKTIAQAVEAVAQGGRRGGALIELRNSNHPDILFFIEKKRLIPKPDLASIYQELQSQKWISKAAHLAEAERVFGERYHEYLDRQNYLRNTNITVLAMPGFMEAVKNKEFYPAVFSNKNWAGPVYDPRRPVMNKYGSKEVNKLTKEFVYHEYEVELSQYPEAAKAAKKAGGMAATTFAYVRGHFYAPEIFARIVEGMRNSGEPGIGFYDHINKGNANDHIYDLNTCNPCGEQFLPAGPGKDGRFYMGTCNLSSMHTAHKTFWNEAGEYDYSAMMEVAAVMQRYMDNVSDISWYPVPEQNMTTRMERRNGGGFAGVAEYLSRLGLEFGSEEALKSTEELYRWYTLASVEASSKLAKERGTYPLYVGSRFHKAGIEVRNSCMTNNAPTGTLAQALQTSWGVDPHNGIVFSRKVRSRKVDFVAPGFREAMEKHGAWPADEDGQNKLMEKIRNNEKSCRGLAEVPDAVQKAFPLRVEITPDAYIRHLAALHDAASDYPWAFNSVSNTCSIPADTSAEFVMAATMLAYELGVKDLTFYPDGSRLSQPVEQIAAAKSETKKDLLTLLGHMEPKQINVEETTGVTFKVKVGAPEGASTLHVSLNHEVDNPGQLVEVYARMGKPGAIESGLFEAIGRLVSAFLQYAARFGSEERTKVENIIIKQLINIQSGYPAFFKFAKDQKPSVIQSPSDGLARAILQYRKLFIPKEKSEPEASLEGPGITTGRSCTHCFTGSVIRIDGCSVCEDCGASRC